MLSAVAMQCKGKTHVNGVKKCLCMHSSALVLTPCKRKKHVKGLKNVFLYTLTFMWWNHVHCPCCGRSKPNPITWFKL